MKACIHEQVTNNSPGSCTKGDGCAPFTVRLRGGFVLEVKVSNLSPNKGVWISKEILAMKDLSIGEKMVLAHMASFPDFFAKDSTIAANLHMNQRTVERLIAGLRAKGHIKGKWRTRKPTTRKCVVNYAKMSSPTTQKCVDNINKNTKVIKIGGPEAPRQGETNDLYLSRLLKQSGFNY